MKALTNELGNLLNCVKYIITTTKESITTSNSYNKFTPARMFPIPSYLENKKQNHQNFVEAYAEVNTN